MPWRHIDIDVRDDFLANYNEGDAERLAEFTIPLRPSPWHLLYVCGLTTTFRHPELSSSIKDPNGKVLTIDDFLKLPVWNGTVVSKGDPILDDQRPQLCNTPPLEVGKLIPEKSATRRGVEKPNSKIVRARRNQKLTSSELEGTISVTPLRQAVRWTIDETASSIPKVTTENVAIGTKAADVEKEIIDLSENTRMPTPPIITVQPLAHAKRDDTQENGVFFDDNDENMAEHHFVPEWRLREDLRICYYKACKELISHLATPVEEEFLSDLSNVEVVRRAYQSLGSELLDKLKYMEKERDEWRQTASVQVKKIKTLEETIELKSKRLTDVEKKSLAVPIGMCFTSGWLGGLCLGKKEDKVVAMLSETNNLDIKGSKKWKDKHRELFTMQYPYVQKIVDSYRLPMNAFYHVPPPTVDDGTGPSNENKDDVLDVRSPSQAQMMETAIGAPPKTTT
nr:hypothetical protein [Tanacetum cinerariifolium]